VLWFCTFTVCLPSSVGFPQEEGRLWGGLPYMGYIGFCGSKGNEF